MECYACDNEATRQCRRCTRHYCQLHGGDLCAACLSPTSSLPPFNLYRGSLLVLLIGTAVALWLLVRPPGSGNGHEVVIPGFTPTTVVSVGDATPSPVATSETPGPTSTADAGRTPTPQTTATAEQRVYVVQANDSLTAIGEQFAPPGVDPFQYAIQIAAASGLASVDEQIFPGQILVLP